MSNKGQLRIRKCLGVVKSRYADDTVITTNFQEFLIVKRKIKLMTISRSAHKLIRATFIILG